MRKFGAIALFFAFAALFQPALHAQDQKKAHTCKNCNMNFDNAGKKFSVVVPKGIEFSEFDDIGCALLWKNGECAMRQDAFDNNALVYDYRTEESVPIQSAFFVVEAGLKTPMGHGIVAFKVREQAEQLVAELKKGKVVKYAELDSLKLK